MKTTELMTMLGYQPLPFSFLWQSFSQGTKNIHIDGLTVKPFTATLSMNRNNNDDIIGRVLVTIKIQGIMDEVSYGIEEDPNAIIQNLPVSISQSWYLQDIELVVNAVWKAYQKASANDLNHPSIFDQPCVDHNVGYAALVLNTLDAGINEFKEAFGHLNIVFPKYKGDYIFMSLYNGCCGKLHKCGVDYHTLL